MPNPLSGSILHLLHRAAQITSENVMRETGDVDVTPRQIAVLTAISVADGASQTDIVAATGVDRSTLTEIVGRLAKKGLIKRRRSKLDARAMVLTITDSGTATLKSLTPALERAEAKILEALPIKRRDELLATLRMLSQ